MVDAAIARSRELTAHKLMDSHSPPVSPGEREGGSSAFFDDDSPGLLSKLKNSIKRNGGHEESRQRTFSEELESKGDLDDEVTPEAQQAYNMLVVKGSFKDNKTVSAPSPAVRAKPEGSYRNDSVVPTPPSRQQPQQPPYGQGSATRTEPDLIRDSKRGVTPPRVSAPIAISSPIPQVSSGRGDHGPAHVAPIPASRPTISAPTSPPPPVPSKATPPVPAPRPVVKVDSTKRSEIPVPKPRPEIQRVEPTIRQTVAPPASPDIPPKKIESQIPVPAQSKEREREELKRTIEIVRVTDADSSSLRDDLSERAASTSFDRSSARSSQRSSLDRSDNLSENAESERADWEHSECSSDSSNQRRLFGGSGGISSDFERGDHQGLSSGGRYTASSSSAVSTELKDSLSRKPGGNGTTSTALFEEDLSEPSPQEIMSRLRERRLNRQIDHQRALASSGGGDGTSEPAPTIARNRPSAREPQGIPGRKASIDMEESSGGGGDSGQPDEVDTNPLRMLRGGAIPIRTAGGRSSASGTGNHGNQGAAVALASAPAAPQEPLLNFSCSSPLCRSTDGIIEVSDRGMDTCSRQNLEPEAEVTGIQSASASEVCSKAAAAEELTKQLEILTATLMEGDLAKVASAVVDVGHSNIVHPLGSNATIERELDKFSSSLQVFKSDSSQISVTTASSTQTTSSVETTVHCSAVSPSVRSVTSSSSKERRVSVEKPSTLLLQVKPTLLPTAASPTAVHSSDSSDDEVWVRRDDAVAEDISSKEMSMPSSQVPPVSSSKVEEEEKERVTPPRLPPRRSQSLSDNPEQDGRMLRTGPEQKLGVRRSHSTVEDVPVLPPRKPQPWRTPLNARPRERKFPLLVHPSSSSPPSDPNTPSPPTSNNSSPRRVLQNSPIYNTPRSSQHSPKSRQAPTMQGNDQPPPRPARLSPNSLGHQMHQHHPPLPPKQSLLVTPLPHPNYPPSPSASISPTSPPRNFLQSDATGSVELPPTYDLSISPEFETGSPLLRHGNSDRDRDSTHILLDPHTSHKQNTRLSRSRIPPPLSVSLPPSKDLTLSDEPTHVSLSSLAQNKLSWSSSFPSPSSPSPSFQHPMMQMSQKRVNPSNLVYHTPQSSSSTGRPLGRSCSQARGPHLSEDAASSQSPPADLPPAPPTPSYRHKLGLDTTSPQHGKHKIARSFSHNPAASSGGSPSFVHDGNGDKFLPVDLIASYPCDRVTSQSLRLPSRLVPSSPSTQQVFPPSPYLCSDNNSSSNRCNLGIFADAPSVPHPYSQTPFHPIPTSTSPDSNSQCASTIYSSIVPQSSALLSQALNPHQVPNHAPFSISPHSEPLSMKQTPPPLSPPRSSSHTVMQAYTSSHRDSLSPPPRPPPLGSTHQRASSNTQQQTLGTTVRTSEQQVFQFPARSCSTSLRPNPSTTTSASGRPTFSGARGCVTTGEEGEDDEAEVSPLMFTGFSATSSASYEDLQQFSLER